MKTIIDVTLENGEVAFEGNENNLDLLTSETITLDNGATYAVGNIDEEYDDFYGATRYTIHVY